MFASDIDGDGDADMIVANGADNSNPSTVSVLKNIGDSTFANKVDYTTGNLAHSVFAIDIDGDGDADILVANLKSSTVSILKNNGDGTFADKVDYITGNTPISVYASDIDRDGDVDILVTNDSSNTVSVLKNNGDGTFVDKVDYPTGNFPYSVFVSDIDEDGDVDMLVTCYSSNTVSVLKNNGDGTFADKVDYTTGSLPEAVFASDIDGDGDADMLVVNGASNTISILKNNGDGTFTGKMDYPTGSTPHSVYASDVDGDGDADMVVVNRHDNTVSIFKNECNGSLSGTKFNDLNANGIKDGGEPGLPNWSIYLSGAASETTLTDVNGNYSFTNLQAGTYTISEEQRSGWEQTFPVSPSTYTITLSAGQDTTGFDFGNIQLFSITASAGANGSITPSGIITVRNGHDTTFTITPNSNYRIDSVIVDGIFVGTSSTYTFDSVTANHTIRATFAQSVGSISGRKFEDVNGNGIFDGSDGVLGGWRMYLSYTCCDTAPLASTLTDINGYYLFSNLLPDNYTISEQLQSGWLRTFPDSGYYTIALSGGDSITGKDFGNYKYGSISGQKFSDENANGIQDSSESGVKNWKIYLAGSVNDSTTTDSLGYYSFRNLFARTYDISEESRNGWVRTLPLSGMYNVSITSGDSLTGFDFGNFLFADTVKLRTFRIETFAKSKATFSC
ncbi:MAG: VCBS repeat-containing protein, partial [Ignavibacteriae bacterium]|nr:VCBS repeat-containing protein [Ignavibacteriota bacterium]